MQVAQTSTPKLAQLILSGEDCFAAVVQGPPVATVRKAIDRQRPVEFQVISSAAAVVAEDVIAAERQRSRFPSALRSMFPDMLALSVVFEEPLVRADATSERWILPRGRATIVSSLWRDYSFEVVYLPTRQGYYDIELPGTLGNWHLPLRPAYRYH